MALSGHGLVRCTCLLLTQSGNRARSRECLKYDSSQPKVSCHHSLVVSTWGNRWNSGARMMKGIVFALVLGTAATLCVTASASVFPSDNYRTCDGR